MDLLCQSHSNSIEFSANEIGAGHQGERRALCLVLGVRSPPPHRVKCWEIIADNLHEGGWSWGCVSAVDSNGQTIWIADAHRSGEKRFVVHADEKLTASVELESAMRARQEAGTGDG